jgi:hypothetical protein
MTLRCWRQNGICTGSSIHLFDATRPRDCLAPIRHQFGGFPHRLILGVDVAHEHHHSLVSPSGAMPTLTGILELVMSVAERWRIPCVHTCVASVALSMFNQGNPNKTPMWSGTIGPFVTIGLDSFCSQALKRCRITPPTGCGPTTMNDLTWESGNHPCPETDNGCIASTFQAS